MLNLLGESDRERRIRERREARNIAAGTIVGTLIGATIGVLFAPKSGKETREDLRAKANEGMDKAEQAMDNAVAEIKEKSDEVSQNFKEKYNEYADRNMIDISGGADLQVETPNKEVEAKLSTDQDENKVEVKDKEEKEEENTEKVEKTSSGAVDKRDVKKKQEENK